MSQFDWVKKDMERSHGDHSDDTKAGKLFKKNLWANELSDILSRNVQTQRIHLSPFEKNSDLKTKKLKFTKVLVRVSFEVLVNILVKALVKALQWLYL